MKKIAAIEAGGTKFICGIGNENGEILDKTSIPTKTPEETMKMVIDYFKDKEFEAATKLAEKAASKVGNAKMTQNRGDI